MRKLNFGWGYSINHKDIGTLYLYYGAIAGIVEIFIYFILSTIEIPFIFWMKIREVLKYNLPKKRNYNFNRYLNRNYSRPEQINVTQRVKIVDILIEKNDNILNLDKKQLGKQFIEMTGHPTDVDIKEVTETVIKISISNLTTKNKSIKIQGEKIDVEYIGKIKGKDQYLVKAVIEMRLDRKQFDIQNLFEKENKFKFSEEDNKRIISKIKEIFEKNKDILKYDLNENKITIGNYEMKGYETKEEFFNNFKNID